jgi:hypothetical protein
MPFSYVSYDKKGDVLIIGVGGSSVGDARRHDGGWR